MRSRGADDAQDDRRDEETLSVARALTLLFSPELADPLDDLLRLVGEGMGVSRAYLFQFRAGGTRMDNTHEWCAPGVDAEIERLQDVPCDEFPWWMERLRSGEGVVVRSMTELPPEAEAERALLEAQGIEAVLVLPLGSTSGELLGFIGFDEVGGPREWSVRERESLRLICQLGTRELERRRAVQGLRRVQSRLLRTERIARVGGWEFEPGTGVTWWSEQAKELLGIAGDRGTATLFDLFQRIHPDDRERTRRTFLRSLDDGEAFRFECRVMTGAGAPCHVEVQGTPRGDAGDDDTPDSDGRSGIVVGTVQDITERRLLEEQLREAQRMDAVGKLAGGVAHDFNNLLSLILGSAGFLLEASPDEDPRRNDMLQIRQAAERGAQLTRQLLAFSRTQMLEPRRLELAEALGGVRDLVRRLLPEDVQLEVDLAADVGQVNVDPAQLEQVIINLVVNARDALAENGGTVRISTRFRTVGGELEVDPGQRLAPGSYAVIAVEDDGAGMTPEVRARVFEPFFTTKPAGQGVGLGLSSAYGIVQQSGGAILVESTPGEGSRFLVHLPAVHAEAAPAPDPDPAGSLPTPEETSGTTVLLVEDDPELARMVKRILERAGYAVISSHDPADALVLSHEHEGELDLLVTDVVMPEIDGRKLARQIQRQRPGIRVLFMSGYAPEVISRKGVVQPEDHFLPKPFSHTQLVEKVRQVMRAGAPIA